MPGSTLIYSRTHSTLVETKKNEDLIITKPSNVNTLPYVNTYRSALYAELLLKQTYIFLHIYYIDINI